MKQTEQGEVSKKDRKKIGMVGTYAKGRTLFLVIQVCQRNAGNIKESMSDNSIEHILSILEI